MHRQAGRRRPFTGLGCEGLGGGLENMCLHARIAHICTSNSLLEQYNSLFLTSDADDVARQFMQAFGDSIAEQDPLFLPLIESVRASAARIESADFQTVGHLLEHELCVGHVAGDGDYELRLRHLRKLGRQGLPPSATS